MAVVCGGIIGKYCDAIISSRTVSRGVAYTLAPSRAVAMARARAEDDEEEEDEEDEDVAAFPEAVRGGISVVCRVRYEDATLFV
jgi:hypothetical protein